MLANIAQIMNASKGEREEGKNYYQSLCAKSTIINQMVVVGKFGAFVYLMADGKQSTGQFDHNFTDTVIV